MIVLACLLSTAAAVVLTMRAEKEYASTAALLLRPATAIETQRVVETNLQLLSLPALAEKTAESVEGVNKAEVVEAVEAGQEGESDIIKVHAVASSPALAAELANVFSEEFIKFREGDGEQQLTGGVELVERATADDEPVAPNSTKNIAFGAIVGLVLGFGLALLLEQLDRRVTRQQEVADATGLPVLAQIPKRRAFESGNLARGEMSAAELEVFQLLRANLRYFNVRNAVRSVLVTSAESGEGKSLVGLGLALAAATSGERVLLIEADMRNPGLAESLGKYPRTGLSLALASGADSLDELITSVKVGDIAPIAGDHRLDVILAGPVPPNPVELIESRRMSDLVKHAEEVYDFVVIDTPPALVVSDAIPLMSSVSGVLAVTGLGVSTKNSAADLAEQLERLRAPVLGLIVNFATRTGRSYDSYGYGRPPDLPLVNGSAPQAKKARPRPRRQAQRVDQ